MKWNRKKVLGVLSFLSCTFVIVLAFQNCAKIDFESVESLSSSLDPSNTDPGQTPPSDDPSGSDPGGNPNPPSGTDPGSYKQTRTVSLTVGSQTVNSKTQLLYVIDDSFSMSDSVEKLNEQTETLVSSLAGKDIELGLTTVWYATKTSRNTYYDQNGNVISGIANYADPVTGPNWKDYIGQTIRVVSSYEKPGLISVNLAKLYEFYKMAACAPSGTRKRTNETTCNIYKNRNAENTALVNFIDSRLLVVGQNNRYEGAKVISFSKNMSANEFKILSDAIRLTVKNMPLKQDQGESYERGLCVISSYLKDNSANSFLKASNTVGIVVISDEDDYSGAQNEKCNETKEITFKVDTKLGRYYSGRFKSVIPLGGDATLKKRRIEYSYDQCRKTTVTTVYDLCDGKQCDPHQVSRTEYSTTLPCDTANGWEKMSVKRWLDFDVLQAGTGYGDACTSAEISQGAQQVEDVTGEWRNNNLSTGSCYIPTPGHYETFAAYGESGREIELYVPSDVDGISQNLCMTSFTSQGVRYSNLLDYQYKFYYDSAAYLSPVEGSCSYLDNRPEVTPGPTVIKTILSSGNNFGQYIADIAKSKYAGRVFVSSIVNIYDRGSAKSCIQPDTSQSVGSHYISLSNKKYLGDHAKASSICDDSYEDPLINLSNQVSTVQRQFKVELNSGEVILSVTIVKGTQNIELQEQDFAYANGILNVSSNDLVAGAKIIVGIGKLK